MGTHLVRQFARVRTSAYGDVVIDGLILLCPFAFDYDLYSLKEATSSMRINMDSSIAMWMIIKEGHVYCLILKEEEPPHPLPVPEKTIV